MSVPVALTLSQPIFGVNNIKWNRRIEPVRYAEAKASFISATENVALTAIQYFFNLLLAKENVSIAAQNLANASKLYEVAKAKREMGRISKNDLLQLELNLLNAESSLTDSESNYRASMFGLQSFLNIEEEVTLDPVVPSTIPQAFVSYPDVLEKAHANNSFAKTYAAASSRPTMPWPRQRATNDRSCYLRRWVLPVPPTASVRPTTASRITR